jgi:hypothetical protein
MLVAETGPADTTRYQMLETLRQHAQERLDVAGDADEFRRRHAQHYARFAEEAGAALVGREELAWRVRVNAERDNLRAAVYWALDRDDDDTLLALRIIAALAYEVIMDPPGGIGAWAERAFDTAVRSSARERRAVLAAAAYEASNLAQYDLVLSRAAAARLDVAADSIAPGLLSFAENWFVAQQGDQLTAMRGSCEAADELMRAGTDAFGLVMMQCTASFFAMGAGELVTARAQAESALELARRMGNPSAVSSALFNLGRSIEHDDPARALDAFEQAIALGRAGATPVIMGPALADVARLRSHTQDRRAALETLQEAIGYGNHAGWRPMLADVLGAGVEILLRVGEGATATVLAGSLVDGVLAMLNVSFGRTASLERALTAAREELGDEQFGRLFTRGAGMSYEEVVEFALDEVRRAMSETTRD